MLESANTLIQICVTIFASVCNFVSGPLYRKGNSVREGVKNICRGGSLNLAAEGREVLTPPKNAEMGPYPP